jgi:hypothetical protein
MLCFIATHDIYPEYSQSIQDSRKFYKRLNDVRRPVELQVAMCRAKNGELSTNKNQVLARWKEHFEVHLNAGSESKQSTRPVDLRDDGIDRGAEISENQQSSRRGFYRGQYIMHCMV